MRFYIEINYKKGPTFSTEIIASSEQQAKEWALKDAKSWGFDAHVKKIIIRGMQ